MNHIFTRSFLILSVLVGVVAYVARPAHAQSDIYGPCPVEEIAPEPSGDNLLVNPSFEWPYYYLWQEAGVGNGCIPSGWVHWYSLPEGDDRGDYYVPEWKPVHLELEAPGVLDGETSVSYYKPWAYHLGGLYQQVQVPAGSPLEFSAFGMAWSTDAESPVKYESGDLQNPVPMSIGIDPTGGTSPFGDSVVWSDIATPIDVYQRFSVQATAEGSTVTVFLWSHNGYFESNLPVQWIDVFWDGTGLFVTDGTSATPIPADVTLEPSATPDPNATPTNTPPPAPTQVASSDSLEGVVPAERQPPNDDGAQYHVVQPLDSVLRIAAAYDVEPQAIRDLNNLQTDNLFPDQELLIIPAPQPEAAPTDEPAVEEESEEAAPIELATLCMAVYSDENTDGQFDQGEPTVAGVNVNLSGTASDFYTTEAATETFCFEELQPGEYLIQVQPPVNYELAGEQPFSIDVASGGDVALNIPLIDNSPDEPAAEQAPAEEDPIELPPTRREPNRLVIGLLIAGVGMVITSAVTTVIITRQPR